MKALKILIPLAIIVVILASSAFFTVREGQQAIVTQFGKPVGGAFKEAGLYFKIPFIQEVHFFDSRVLKWDGKPNQIPTADKKYIWVDTTARWRITNPLLFLQTVATETGASSRLDDILDSVVRDLVSSNLLVELVRSEDWKALPDREIQDILPNSQLEALKEEESVTAVVKKGRRIITLLMLTEAAKLVPQYGIKLIDVEIKRINYVESVQKRVYERMISERKRIASQYRSEGEGENRRILGTMQKELARIRSEAYKRAEGTRGEADAKATKIYGDAFGKDPKFYAIFNTLESYKNQPPGKTELILSTDGDYFRYLQKVQTPE